MTDPALALAPTGFDALIGLELTSVTGDEVRARLVVTPDLLQPYGLLHGGVLCTVVETLGSVGGGSWYGERGKVVGTSNHTDLLRSAHEGDVLQAVATPVHRGRSQQLWTVDVRDESDRLIARGQLRVANLPAS
jgi:1,4-dihydroxy-2-naphthoyl-CoA hydrolase